MCHCSSGLPAAVATFTPLSATTFNATALPAEVDLNAGVSGTIQAVTK